MLDSRTLIRTYRESEWRSTRFEVIRGLSRFPDGRSFQFLVEIIENNQDLAEQELALLSLSQHRNRTAVAFIKKYRADCPDTLRAAVAFAIGQSQIYDFSRNLLEDLNQAKAKQDTLWMKNLVLSLGELKEFRAVAKFHELLSDRNQVDSDLMISVFLSLGRLERNLDAMTPYLARVSGESLLNQIFQSALSQIQIRSQFKLEDYLSKTFEVANPHPALPLELKAFDEDEVRVGLSLFPVEKFWERYLFAFRGLSPKLRLELLPAIFGAAPSPSQFLNVAAKAFSGLENSEHAKACEKLCGDSLSDLELRLQFCDVFAEDIDFMAQSAFFLKKEISAEFQVRFLNLWHESALAKSESPVKKEFGIFAAKTELKDEAYARLIRASAEQGIEVPEITSGFTKLFEKPALRASLLLYAERFALSKSIDVLESLSRKEIETSGLRVLAVIESLAENNKLAEHRKFVIENLRIFEGATEPNLWVGVLRVLRFSPISEFEKFVIESAKNSNPLVELNAIIALKRYVSSREASELLTQKLESKNLTVRGRALDALCAHSTLLAKRSVLQYLEQNLSNEEVVDKVYRSFDPENKGGAEFVQTIEKILKQNPDHPLWEKLLSLKERVANSTAPTENAQTPIELSPEVNVLDARLKILIPKFDTLDATTKFALRAAEQPFVQTQSGQQSIDKAPTVLEYCKALDLILDKSLGQKHLFPKLDIALHDFQTLWHRIGFGEDYPQLDKVVALLALKGKITPELFPLHKAKMMCGTFFNGKILQDRFKIFDGLRAWAVIFLVFTRKIPLSTGTVGPLLKIDGVSDEQAITIAKKLMTLQDLRNPAAHRQTYTDLSIVENVRAEAVSLINIILG